MSGSKEAIALRWGLGGLAWADDKASSTLGAVFSKHQLVKQNDGEVRKANSVSRSYPWAGLTVS
eukprot:6272621-Amphidinium_carterae.1